MHTMKTRSLITLLFLLLPATPLFSEGGLLNLPLPESGLHYNAEQLRPRWPERHGEGVISLWGDDKHAALSVTIDDNNAPDIPFWQEMSKEFGWKFTWFVIVHPMMWDIFEDKPGTNTGYFGSAEDFKPLHDQGHEIGLHGSCKVMNDLDADTYRLHIGKSRAHLESVIGNTILTYAYPCGATGENGIYRKVIGETMIGARGTSGGPTPVHLADFLQTNSMGAANLGNAQTRRRFQMLNDPDRPLKYSYYRGWPVLLYHNVGDESKQAGVRKTFEAIKEKEDQFWIQPFGTVAAYAQQRATAELNMTSVTPDRIVFTLSDRMDDEIFQVPLTVKIRVDGWDNAAAKQGDSLLNTRVVQHEGRAYVLVDAVPDRGPVILIQR